MENRDFIVFGLSPWDTNLSNTCIHTANEIARKNRVLFVNTPLTRSELYRRSTSSYNLKRKEILALRQPDLIQVSPSMWVLNPRTVIESINWINNRKIFDFFNEINDRRFAGKVKEAIEKLGFKDFIILDDNSMIHGFYFKEMLKPKLLIYLLRDAVLQVKFHQRHGTVLEPLLIKKTDFTVTNSEFFRNYASEFNKNSFMIGQGCDLSLFNDNNNTLPIPSDMKEINGKIIGYVGALTTIRLDIDILVHIAKERPDWKVVLVGPEDDKFKMCELHNLDNVIFLGRKNPQELPAYIKSFDVALNPQLRNKITDVNYPLKIDEYLAMGKPVVATNTTFMAYFREYTYLADNKFEYVPCIERAIAENTPLLENKRKIFAASHSWENFVNKIYSHAEAIELSRTRLHS